MQMAKLQWVHGRITVVMVVATTQARWCYGLLQWVHGRITVVMSMHLNVIVLVTVMQWVHGRITVVMVDGRKAHGQDHEASMGPRSDNRGYAETLTKELLSFKALQWVHGRITVVMAAIG